SVSVSRVGGFPVAARDSTGGRAAGPHGDAVLRQDCGMSAARAEGHALDPARISERRSGENSAGANAAAGCYVHLARPPGSSASENSEPAARESGDSEIG